MSQQYQYDFDEDELPTEADEVAKRLDDEVPYETCSKLFTHESWLDLVQTIKDVSPAAYAALVADLVKEKS